MNRHHIKTAAARVAVSALAFIALSSWHVLPTYSTQAATPTPERRATKTKAAPQGRTTTNTIPASPRPKSLAVNQQPRVDEFYHQSSLLFEANQGQVDSRILFYSRGSGRGLYLLRDEAVLKFGATHAASGKSSSESVVRMKLLGADAGAEVRGVETQSGVSNYFIGNDPARWRTNIPNYARVEYKNIYRGIDLVYYSNQRQLEYDFVVAPGSDPKLVALQFSGLRSLRLNARGDLLLATAGGSVRMLRPRVYQEADGVRREIAGRYTLRSGNRVGFEVGAYDASRPLVIDPIIEYATFFGGSGVDRADAIAADASGNAYITGRTNIANFPHPSQSITTTTIESYAFVAKLNTDGSLNYLTYFGGSRTASINFARRPTPFNQTPARGRTASSSR